MTDTDIKHISCIIEVAVTVTITEDGESLRMSAATEIQEEDGKRQEGLAHWGKELLH